MRNEVEPGGLVHDGVVTRIRPEQPADIPGTRAVNLAAFETSTEADLVDVLRERADPIVSLVADAGNAIVGHILFSPATLPGYPELRIMGLAPMAVAPARQRQGIGAALIHEGFEQCRRLGCRRHHRARARRLLPPLRFQAGVTVRPAVRIRGARRRLHGAGAGARQPERQLRHDPLPPRIRGSVGRRSLGGAVSLAATAPTASSRRNCCQACRARWS